MQKSNAFLQPKLTPNPSYPGLVLFLSVFLCLGRPSGHGYLSLLSVCQLSAKDAKPAVHVGGIFVMVSSPVILAGHDGLFQADQRIGFGGQLAPEVGQKLNCRGISLRNHDHGPGVLAESELLVYGASQETWVFVVIQWVSNNDNLGGWSVMEGNPAQSAFVV